jgi:aldehyde dehydrogenase (NAD+)
MAYIESGKADGAKLVTGGGRQGTEGFYIEPTIFTDTHPNMKIVREEIFGPVGVIIKFKTEEGAMVYHFLPFSLISALLLISEAIEMANDTSYGLACGVFTENNSRAIRVAHSLEAGTAWVSVPLTNLIPAHFLHHLDQLFQLLRSGYDIWWI